MMAGTAAGELLPPYVFYKANNIYDTWTTGGPRGTRYNRTGSGWIDGNTFEDYIKTIVVPFFKDRPGKKVLIGDNLSSHLSLEVIRLCEEENISFIFLPANSTHLTQPLDIAFFRPMKIAWRNILAKWKKTDGRNQASVPKGCFPRLLKNLLNDLSVNVESNLKAGFRKAGIVPIDPEQVLSRLPKDDEDPDRNRYAVDKSVLEILKEMRYGTMNVKEPARKRKLNAETGKSLENIDVDNLESEPENKMTNKRHKTCKKGSKNKKLQVIPGKAVHLDSKICDTVNNDIENIEPKNVLINEPMKKTTGEISRYKTNQIKEVKQLIEKLNNDLMKIDSSMKTETSLQKDDKNITDINLLPVVYVDEYTIAEKSQKDEKQLTNICNDFQQEDKLVLTNEYTIVNLFEKEDEELLIDNYIEPNASSIHYLPDIETDTNIFSAVCNNEEQENSLQNKEEKAKHQLIEVISSTEKNDKKEEKAKRKKIEIISSTVKIDKKVKLHNCKKIPIQSTINIKKEKSFKKTKQRHQYYKHDADILRDLTDENL